MISRGLLERIYDSAYVQRWNDKVRPAEFTELDKQAHKMTIAYLLGKFQEKERGFDWVEIVEAGIFDFLQRLVLTDLKPELLWKIRTEAPAKYNNLNQWVYSKLEPYIRSLGTEFSVRYMNRFSQPADHNTRIVDAAHLYSSKWEFDFIEKADPEGYEIREIREDFEKEIEAYDDVEGMKSLVLYKRYRNLVEFCGLLRFQYRWGHLHMIPRTSVLGHMFIVAVLSYLFSLEIKACTRRRINNFFTGLFHDLPEVLTRDVLAPIKKSVEGLEDLIKDYEREQMEEKVYPLIPKEWRREFKLYTLTEFSDVVTVGRKAVTTDFKDICAKFNDDKYNPRDGALVYACDKLAAFLETHVAIKNGVRNEQVKEARKRLLKELTEESVLMEPQFEGFHSLMLEFPNPE
jgi:putative hydrolase of HD superfamily